MAAWKEVRSQTVTNKLFKLFKDFDLDVAVFMYDPTSYLDVTVDMRGKIREVNQEYCSVCPVTTCAKVGVNRIDHTVEAVALPGTFTDEGTQAKCS